MRSSRTLTASVALAAGALAVAMACGSESQPVSDTSPPSSSTSSTLAPVGTGETAACADAATVSAPTEVAKSFPDNAEVSWTVTNRWLEDNSGEELVMLEMTPSSTSPGYDEVATAWGCEGAVPAYLGVYVPEGDGWKLLSATGGSALPETLGATPASSGSSGGSGSSGSSGSSDGKKTTTTYYGETTTTYHDGSTTTYYDGSTTTYYDGSTTTYEEGSTTTAKNSEGPER